jgi:DNA-binding MarR family transcriptional regulator
MARAERRARGATIAERLSPAQNLALAAMSEGSLTMGDLAAATGVAVSTATRMVQGLERLGLVARGPVRDEDRRRRYVGLTADGEEVLRRSAQIQVDRLTALLAPLDPEERAAIVAGVRVFTRALAADEERLTSRG